MIEGSKSATSICYSWFCAKKTERKRLRYEEQYRLLLRHKHDLFDKSLTYFRVRFFCSSSNLLYLVCVFL
jgi:hypothetical protein